MDLYRDSTGSSPSKSFNELSPLFWTDWGVAIGIYIHPFCLDENPTAESRNLSS